MTDTQEVVASCNACDGDMYFDGKYYRHVANHTRVSEFNCPPKTPDIGEGYELREVKRWNVHCTHCGTQVIGDTPQTDKAFAHLQRLIADGRVCRNPNCVSRGGTEKRRGVCQ